MTALWLSRARLRRDAPIATLAPMLLPQREDDRVASQHRLIWSLFARGDDNAQRDFLWREDRNGYFYMLSARRPDHNHALFEVDAPKPFLPALSAGDCLRFSLRANATVARPANEFRSATLSADAKASRRTVHHDVVMHALHALPPGSRAESRGAIIVAAGRRWLEAQGARCGFSLQDSDRSAADDRIGSGLRVDGYRVLRPPRPSKGPQMHIAVLEFEGVLTVTDPTAFMTAIGRGFGRAKAYGCGLMLIARV